MGVRHRHPPRCAWPRGVGFVGGVAPCSSSTRRRRKTAVRHPAREGGSPFLIPTARRQGRAPGATRCVLYLGGNNKMPPAALARGRCGCCCSPPWRPMRRVPPAVGRGISFSTASPSSPPLYPAAASCYSPPPPPCAAAVCTVSRAVGHGSRQRPVFNLFVRMEQFWARGSIDKKKGLVEHLQQYGIIKSRKVAEVMETIDRGLFVPDGTAAYVDSPMPIGYNATISAPHMHATCLELLKDHLQPGMRALDIGSGTGYLTACFAMMVGPEGCAVGVEHIPELVASSIENVKGSAAAELLREGSLSLHAADGRLGWPGLAPYDTIHVGAAAPELPQPLIQQLKPGGRMVIPVGNIFQELKVVDKNLDGSVSTYDETSVRYVPLTTRAAQLQGY